ncbi:SPASM domain-containing protein [Kitasatospora sp. NPDC091276]|uniref:radical SAM protein n=1 Tax=Kitasatospora sp. NPDC091276 TaxID=3155300 RepID=UPI003441D3EA
MISDAIPLSTSDASHVSFADGYAFHVRGGQITAPGQPCPCGDLEPVHQITSYREAYPQAQLSLTDVCNMGCTYCSFRDRVHADGKPVTIPLETVVQGLRTHRERLVEEGARYSRVDFGLAGETMLVRHMHDSVQELVAENLADSPVAVVWAGPMVTNATLSMTTELAEQLGPPQDISLDGPRDVHDRVRFYTGDRGGTYDHVRSVLDQVLARHPDMGVSAVLTAYCTDFVAIFRHLFEDVGARNIYMKPVNATHDKEYALNAETLPAFRQGYADLVEHILAQPPEGILARLLALNSEDFLMRFFYRVKDRAAQVYRCGAGKSGTYLDTNGNLYPCAHFIGKSGWHIGHASTGVEETERRKYLDLVVDQRDECSSCPSRYVCGGGCYYQAVLANGDITKPDGVKCDLIRFLTDLSIRLVVTLREQHPEVLDALPSPYGLTDEALGSAPEAAYLPAARLDATTDDQPVPAPLGGPGRVRGGLANPAGLAVTLTRRAEGLAARLDLGDSPGAVQAVRVRLQPLGAGVFTLHDLAAGQWPGDRYLRCTRDGAWWLTAPTGRFRRVPHPGPVWEDARDVRFSWEADHLELLVPLPEPVGSGLGLGVNVFADLADGGWTALTLHEPFAVLASGGAGPLRLSGPEAPWRPTSAEVNGRMPVELTPLGRWAGLQGNTC